MPFYYPLKNDPPFTEEKRDRIARRLLKLRKQIREEVPPRAVTDALLLATWNIRDFDDNKFGHGPRLDESFYYIAEIISSFDLIAVQEVNKDTSALRKVMSILGPNWDYMATDITEGPGGNNERTAFIFDKSKILFRNIVGEIVLPDSILIEEKRQFARTPFYVSFQAGWFKFDICTVHLYYGSDSGEGLERRIAEIDSIAKFLADRARKYDGNFIVLGDFNIVSPEHRTMEALLNHGFEIPEPLRGNPSNMLGTKHYDQIAFITRKEELQLGDAQKNAGAFNYYKSVYTPDEFETYAGLPGATPESVNHWDSATEKQKYYEKEWRTWQMSDHLPLWVQLKIDFSDRYLQALCKPD
jgi:endonuclease/exonuclease/phosphatase family metal-dependent hydrolase